MLYTALFSLFFAHVLPLNEGLRQSGVSLNLPSNIPVKSTGWYKIKGWQSPIDSGHAVIGTKLKAPENADVFVPHSGIYLAYVTVTLTGANIEGRFKVKLLVNDKVNSSHSGMSSSTLGGPLGPKSLSFKGAILLQASDYVSVHVYSEIDTDWSISGQSETTLSLQYIEALGVAPGFSAIIERTANYNSSGWNSLKYWHYEGEPGLFKSMTGFSKHIGEFAAICDGIYIITANVHIKTDATNYFDLGIAVDSIVNGSIIRNPAFKEFTLSISVSISLRKGQLVSLKINSQGSVFTVGTESAFTATRIRSDSATVPGFSTVLQHDIHGEGARWTQISLQKPNGTSFGQFQGETKYITGGSYYPPENGIYIVSANIRIVAESLISACIFTRLDSASRLTGNIVGVYSTITKTDYAKEVTFNAAGTIELLASQNKLSFFIYMQNSGRYRILAGSRISIIKVEERYPAFHATLEADVPQSSDNAWVEISSWKINRVSGSFSLTKSLSATNGRYSAEVSGIYHVSANMIFNAPASVISLLIAANGDQSKRNALFSTKGNPGSNDFLTVSGSLRLQRGDFVSVMAKVTGTSSWSVADKSSFSLAFIGMPFSVPGFSAVFSSTRSFTSDGWHQMQGLLLPGSSGTMFHYGGGLDAANCKYQVPLPGLYVVSANMKLKSATRVGAKFTVNIGIDNNPGSFSNLNGMNDYISRSTSLGSEDFYSMNAVGVVKLQANQSITLWIKSTSAGSWQLSEDSSFSAVMLHPENTFDSSGLQAVLSLGITQTVTGATNWKIVRSWSTARSSTEAGLFSLGDYQELSSSSGTIVIRQSGLYFVSASITLKDAVGKFEVGIHLESRLAALYSVIDSRLYSYTVKVTGMLFIAKGQTLSVQVKAPLKMNWEQDVMHCGLSFVKLGPFVIPTLVSSGTTKDSIISLQRETWRRVDNWKTSLTNTQLLLGNGFSKSSGVYNVQNSGVFIISGFLETESTKASPSVEMKISVNGDDTNITTTRPGNGLSTVNSKCNKSCVLFTSGVFSLATLNTVAVFVKSNEALQLKIKNSSMFSISFVAESFPLPNGMFGQLTSVQTVKVKGNKQITGWQLSPASGNFFGSTGNMDSFYIQNSGIYFVSITIKFRNLVGMTKAFTSLVNIPSITSMLKQDSNSIFSLSVTGCMKINSGSSYTVTVFSETDSDFEILSGSSKSAIFLGTSVIGFTATQSATKSLTLFPGKASVVSGWTILGKDWLFESGSGFHDRISYLVPETGVYYVSSQIIVSLNTNSTEVTLSLGVLLDGFLKRENRLYSSTSVNGLVTETLLISGSLFLQKWTQLKLVMFASRTATVDIGIDSTYSIVKTSKNLRVPPCADNGPNIIGKLDPDDLRTSYRKSVGWQCQAVGQSVSYSWLKNYQPLPGATSQSLQIASTQVSDTGEYICAASQDGIRVTSNIAKLTVYDPVPVFMNQASDYDLITPENGPNSTSIVYIQARARSLDNAFAMMSFEIVSGNVNNTFYLNPTSSRTGTSLFRKIPLDREILANYTITVKATNLEALSIKYQQINITVDDLNDNSPIFTQSKYESFIYENTTIGTTVARVLATDRDIGENSVIKYWFIPSSAKSVFSVNPTTGYVTLDAPIDRETRDLYVIFVKASDKSHSTYSELSIKILDINEHKPVFNKHYYSVNVSETILPGSSIIAVAASDNDTGSNADLTYSIVGGDPANMFRITKYGMIQNKKSLNYEQNKTFTLTVSVRDNGKPPLYSIRTAVVVIGITDANDNSPKFDKGNYIVNVFENQTVGALILTVHAQDNDAPGQPESLLSYAMEEKALQIETFSISSTNGEIKLNKSLDYERINLYRFTVIAKDNGIPSLQDKALVAVNVLDVNDNRPYFKQLYFAVNVTESSQVNREIFKVTATDADAGLNAELRYYLQSGNHGNTFVVDPVAGNVIAMKPLDREKGVFYSLVISCKDMGSPQLEAVAPFRLDIHILDENDNSPRFNLEKYSTKISENTPVGSTILFMNVTDPDEGQNGNFSVSIVENGARSIFEYNQSKGVLVLKKRLDYEVQSKYHFTVIAKDYGIPSLEKSALVDIEVTDVNDNAPRFSQSSYDTQVQDMVYANVTMFQMIATDPDIGPAKRITYEIVSGNVDGQFRIGKYSGIVETTKFLNTTFINMFKLEVVAKDGFNPPAISNRTVLNIHVTKTPAIWLTNLKAGTTSLEATVDVSEFSYLKITDYRILVQLFEPDDPKLNVAASMPPITWYRVNTELSALNKIRRYATLVIPASRLNGTKLSIVIGTETGCHKKPVDVCNGPLTPNKKYRIQVRGTTINSKFPRDSHFSTPISLGEPAASVAELVDSGSKDGAIGLAIAFGVSTLLTIFILIGYVQYKRKHQLIEVEHVNKHLELVQNLKYDEQLTPRSGFGALSDIGVWPEMSMAEVSHMFQRSQGPKDHKAPRSPGDSGINHGNDDEESWRLNISDEGEEPWEAREQNIRPRDQNGLLSSLQNKSLQPSRIVNSDSNTSLDTSTERFQLPMLSDSLNFVRSDANKREARVNTKPYSNKVGEEIETEIETEFGPEIETTLGADADLSSIDEEL